MDCAGHGGRRVEAGVVVEGTPRPELRTNGGSDLFYPKASPSFTAPYKKNVFFTNN
jgi:hypothetical protein